MYRIIIASIFFFQFTTSVQSQKVHDTVFLNSKWEECNRHEHTYYRIKTSTKDGYFLKDYYKNGQLQMKGYYLKGEDEIQDGIFKYYYENGNIMEECNYVDGKYEGEWKTYYPSGNLHFSQYFRNNLLEGKRMVYYRNDSLKREEIFEDNDLISSACYKPDGSLDIYTPFDLAPKYVGGNAARIKFLQENIIYPIRAREKNISGMVYITFMVSKDGEIEDVEILKGVHKLLNNEALRVVKIMPPWIPGKIDGENARVRNNMPIKFTLAY